MKEAEQDYRIWKNKNFVVESTINFSLWDEMLINGFHEKLNKILNEVKFILLIESRRSSYIPVTNATVPPETPGILFTAPMARPFKKRNMLFFSIF